MRVFVTGATGFIGSATVRELMDAGHQVLGLARSDEAAAAVAETGAEVHRGSLEDLESLRTGAAAADGVIHTAYIHDFSQMEHTARANLSAIETMGGVLEGSGRPLVVTSGTALVNPGTRVTEEDWPEEDWPDPAGTFHPRFAAELTTRALGDRGVRTSIVRPGASVHGEGDHGFVPYLINLAREKGVSSYIGDGSNRWPAVHRLDTARLYRLAVEEAPAGSVLHAVADEGVPAREIAGVIGRHLGVPVVSIAPDDAQEHFDWMATFWSLDAPASSALTQQRMGWSPEHLGLIADLELGHYFRQSQPVAA